MMARGHNDRTGWIGIPSVPPERAAQAFIAFYLAIAAAIAIDVLLIAHNHDPETWQLTAEMVFDDGGQIVAWSLAATWPIMEAMRMVLASIFEKRAVNRGREEMPTEFGPIGTAAASRLRSAANLLTNHRRTSAGTTPASQHSNRKKPFRPTQTWPGAAKCSSASSIKSPAARAKLPPTVTRT